MSLSAWDASLYVSRSVHLLNRPNDAAGASPAAPVRSPGPSRQVSKGKARRSDAPVSCRRGALAGARIGALQGVMDYLEHWRAIQAKGYFEDHPAYGGLREFGSDEAVYAIEQFRPLASDAQVVVIGCGYGRESLGLARRARGVWGIDVSAPVLRTAIGYLAERGVHNFRPVLAGQYAEAIPDGIDIVFSLVVMQHLPREFVRDYFATLGAKLRPGGCFVVQFLENMDSDEGSPDIPDGVEEPSVSWTVRQLAGLADHAGLAFTEVRSIRVAARTLWHWAYFVREH